MNWLKKLVEKKPSEESEEYWVYASNKKKKKYESLTGNCGKWLIFAYNGVKLDGIWKGVKKATERGLLGDSAKCSTMRDNPNSINKKSGVICVYTYDSKDKEDLKRVAKELFKIKDVDKLCYKEDSATFEGKYSVNGDKNISKWFVTKENFNEGLR